MDGYDSGQRNGLQILGYIQIAHIFHYFNEYELDAKNYGTLNLRDVQRATQEEMFNMNYVKKYSEFIFDGVLNQKYEFAGWAGAIWSVRLFQQVSNTNFLDKN